MSTEKALQYQITCSGFFLGLLTGDPENKNPSQRVKIIIESLSQELVYAVTCGQQKPPKHFLLPYAVTTLTGNDTAVFLQKLPATTNQQVVLQTDIKPYL